MFSSFLLSKSIFQGAIFREDQRDSIYDLAFKFAVHKINKDPRILPKSLLTYDIQYVDKDDSFHANKQGLYDDDLCSIHGCTVLHMSTMRKIIFTQKKKKNEQQQQKKKKLLFLL